MLTRSRVAGLPVSRVDGPLKVTGQAKYAAEFFELGMLFGVVVPATIACGRIASIDTSAAARSAGVVKVFTHENRPPTAYRDSKWKDQVALPGHPLRPLENDRVLFDGQPVALVVAESFESARDAASLIRVRYLPTEPHTDLDRSLHTSYVPPIPRSKEVMPPAPRGDAQKAFDIAPHRISADFRMEGEHHNPMELFASTVLFEEDGQLTIHDKTQGSQNSHDYVCKVFGLSSKKVIVRNAYVGGSLRPGLKAKTPTISGCDGKP